MDDPNVRDVLISVDKDTLFGRVVADIQDAKGQKTGERLIAPGRWLSAGERIAISTAELDAIRAAHPDLAVTVEAPERTLDELAVKAGFASEADRLAKQAAQTEEA